MSDRSNNAGVGAAMFAGFVGVLLGAGLIYLWNRSPVPHAPTNDPAAMAREATPKSAADSDEREAIDLFKAVKGSVVNVDTVARRRGAGQEIEELKAGTGSGFFWDDDGRVVTNFHVVREALTKSGFRLRVVLADRTVSNDVKVVGVAPEFDLAVLQLADVPRDKIAKIKVGRSNDLEVGQRVYAIGNPFGLSLTLTKGIISALDREIESPAGSPISGGIQTDAPINPGNSGGPLLDKDGRLIGVNTAIATANGTGGNVGIGFAIPSDTVNEKVTELIQSGKTQRPDIGVTLLDQTRLRRYGYPTGAMIARLEPDGPAEKAGLKAMTVDPRTRATYAGDLILKVNGTEVRANADFDRLLARAKPGATVKLTVERGDTTFEVSVTVRGV
jgi:S1-C subfamily serine protease